MKKFQRYLVPIFIVIIVSALFTYIFRYPQYKAQYEIFIYTLDSSGNNKTTSDPQQYKFFNEQVTEFTKSYNKNSHMSCNIYPIQYDCFNYNIILRGSNKEELQSQAQGVIKSLDALFKKNTRYLEISKQNETLYGESYKRNTLVINLFLSFITSIFTISTILKYLNINTKILFFLSFIIGIMSVFELRFYLILACTFMIIFNFLKKQYVGTEYKFLFNIFTLSFIIRILAIILMCIVNYKVYRHYMSFFQPDELFYNNTANLLADQWRNLIFHNPIEVVKIDQYGYNVLQGIINLINGESYFASKVLNSYVSSLTALLAYSFVKNIFNNIKAARYSAIFLTFMPTFILFSTFGLRDIIISFIILNIIYEAFIISSFKDYKKVLYILLLMIILFYFRRYSVVVVMVCICLYLILQLINRFKINILTVLAMLALLSVLSIGAMKVFYKFNVFFFIIDYFKYNSIFKFISGFGLSIVNLDFLTNHVSTNYGRLFFLRFLYPDTIILIATFGLMILGVVNTVKKYYVQMLPLIAMMVIFIFIYKIYYGGWFLRTQLQILHFQIIMIAIGIGSIKWISHLIDQIYILIYRMKL